MRKIITLMLLAIAITAFGQDKIEGIGNFKLKKTTTASIDSFARANDFDKSVIRSWNDLHALVHKDNKLAEVFPDTLDMSNSISYAHYCKETRVFYIPKIEISGIEVLNTFLTFYEDTLVNIWMRYRPKIDEALKLKYGKPELEEKNHKTTCTLEITGETVTNTETTYYEYWKNGHIKCTSVVSTDHDSKCQISLRGYISIGIDQIDEKIRECDRKEEDRLKNKKDIEKKKKLNDF